MDLLTFKKITTGSLDPQRLSIILQNTSIGQMKRSFDLTPYYAGCRSFVIMKFEYDEITNISDDFFPEKFVFLSEIETFSFRGNKLEKIPKKFFQNFKSIVNLDLSQNQFENISDLAFISGEWFNKSLLNGLQLIVFLVCVRKL